MRTFDWSLFELYNDGYIAYEEAIRNADSANELRLAIKLKSQRGEPASAAFAGPDLAIHDYKNAEELEEERKKELAAQEEKKRQFEADKVLRLELEARQLAKVQLEAPLPAALPLELQLAIG